VSEPADPSVPIPLAALGGMVAAGAALAAGELPTAFAGERVGLVAAVSNEFIDRFAASLKDLAVAVFGEQDKTALVVGVVVVSVALGAALGVLARRRFVPAATGFVLFGVVGLASLATDPSSTLGLAVISATLAVVAGLGSLWWMIGPASRGAKDAQGHTWGPGDDPTVGAHDRRQFLYAVSVVGVAASAAGLAGRSLRGRSSVETERAALMLPDPVRSDVASGLPRQPSGVPGLSPYLTPNDDFFQIDTALGTPQVEAEGWTLRVSGMVDEPYELTLDDLVGMDLVEEAVTICCVSNEVGGGLVGNALWRGVALADLLDRAGVHPDATQVVGRSTDGFTVGFPTAAALDGRVAMVAVGMNGEPLPAAHGYPARLIVAGLYGYVSATKWLTEIELTRMEDFDAYWVPRGWAKQAPVKIQSRIDVPRSRAEVDPGRVVIGGVAWAPNVGIDGVEVQIDDEAWQPAELAAVVSDDTWRQWTYEWEATPGAHGVRVRATDRNGTVQTADVEPPRPDGATGHHTIEVRVRAA
jgi:DMSO/TMAO reductase YedYZ molybdopterin-dependent catalytic subunit